MTYLEVFGGGASVLFNKQPSRRDVLNDYNGDLIHFYRCVRERPDELIDRLVFVLNARPDWWNAVRRLEAQNYTDPLERAADFYQVFCFSYGGGGTSFGMNPRGLWSRFPVILEASGRLQNVVIENMDFEKVFLTYDSPQTFCYLDPPYYQTENYYQGFAPSDHERLQNLLLNAQGKWLLSYNDCPEIITLYQKPGICIEQVSRMNNLMQRYESGAVYGEAYRAFQAIVRERPDDRLLYRLGYLSLNGLGTERDKDTAFEYFRKAANLKNEDAVFALGKLYLDPECASFDPAKGIACLKKAAEEFHNSNAAYLLGKVYYEGEFVPKDVNADLPYLFQAANEQNPHALYLLGKLYAYGDGVEQNLEYAKTLLADSSKLENEYAQRLLDRLNNPRFEPGFDLLPGALALLRQTARIFENRLDNDSKISRTVDRKILSKIADKKLAQGLKLE